MRKRAIQILPVALATVLVVGMSLVFCDPILNPVLGIVLFLMAFLFTMILGALLRSNSNRLNKKEWTKALSKKEWRGVNLCLALCLSVWLTNWPLKFAFAVTRPALEEAARELQAGSLVPVPRRFGLFFIRKAELNGKGQPCFWIDDSPSGPTGFVLAPSGDPHYNLWSRIAMDARWHFVKED